MRLSISAHSAAALLISASAQFGCSSDNATPSTGGSPTSDASTDQSASPDSTTEAGSGADSQLPPPYDGATCGYEGLGRALEIAPDIEICAPSVVCTSETCPPPLGDCVAGQCVFSGSYAGLKTLPEAWATYYCDLPGGGCHGVTQVEMAEVTAGEVASALGVPECYKHELGAQKCVGIMAAPPMMVGNSQEATDPSTGGKVALWGLGMTEATGFCYEITGPGGTAIAAVTDRCGGYCKCNGSGFQECGPCVSAADMEPNCSCVGTVPGLHDQCCGMGCPSLQANCDWCASNNHPHFDLDTDTFKWVCGTEGVNGSCKLSKVHYVPCNAPKTWPPGGGSSGCPAKSFACPDGSPAAEQPEIPGTGCCCNWGLTPQQDGTCG